jgi:hypothetical protein
MAVMLAISLVACSGSNGKNGSGEGESGADAATVISGDELSQRLDSITRGAPTAAEIAGLVRMREEETLALDVYVKLGEKWEAKVFSNISAAERTHAAAVKALLDRYSIADPAADHVAGSFVDPQLQSIYDQLVEQGEKSLVDALTVGATVEDLDLADLAALRTDTADIAWVYDNLARGSRNHLRAFVRQLGRNDAEYTPTHITKAEFDSIIAGEMERGEGSR